MKNCSSNSSPSRRATARAVDPALAGRRVRRRALGEAAHPVRQPVGHRLGPVRQRHDAVLALGVQAARDLRLVVHEHRELAEAALDRVGVEVDELVVFVVFRVLRFEHVDVEAVTPGPERQVVAGLRVAPGGALRLDDQRAEQAVHVAAHLDAADVGQVVDRPHALVRHVEPVDPARPERDGAVVVEADVRPVAGPHPGLRGLRPAQPGPLHVEPDSPAADLVLHPHPDRLADPGAQHQRAHQRDRQQRVEPVVAVRSGPGPRGAVVVEQQPRDPCGRDAGLLLQRHGIESAGRVGVQRDDPGLDGGVGLIALDRPVSEQRRSLGVAQTDQPLVRLRHACLRFGRTGELVEGEPEIADDPQHVLPHGAVVRGQPVATAPVLVVVLVGIGGGTGDAADVLAPHQLGQQLAVGVAAGPQPRHDQVQQPQVVDDELDPLAALVQPGQELVVVLPPVARPAQQRLVGLEREQQPVRVVVALAGVDDRHRHRDDVVGGVGGHEVLLPTAVRVGRPRRGSTGPGPRSPGRRPGRAGGCGAAAVRPASPR